MEMLTAAWVVTVLVTGWLLAMGVIRTLAYRSRVDASPGMGRLARFALGAGIVGLVVLVVLTVLIATGSGR